MKYAHLPSLFKWLGFFPLLPPPPYFVLLPVLMDSALITIQTLQWQMVDFSLGNNELSHKCLIWVKLI